MMVRPAGFDYNIETAEDNAFQKNNGSLSNQEIAVQATKEFDHLVDQLVKNNINVEVIEDTKLPKKPDAVFPNNWISFHQPDVVVTHSMAAKKRRLERRPEIIEQLKEKYIINSQFNLEDTEDNNLFLEGTGSMILDRENKIAYACISKRTDKNLFLQFCEKFEYSPIVFTSIDSEGLQIYHTNVIMCLGIDFVIICMESIPSIKERELLLQNFANTGKLCIEISLDQVKQFAGNMIQLKNSSETPYLIMSSSAYNSLQKNQLLQIEKLTQIIHSPLPIIESYGGGSARCMIAEIFNEKK